MRQGGGDWILPQRQRGRGGELRAFVSGLLPWRRPLGRGRCGCLLARLLRGGRQHLQRRWTAWLLHSGRIVAVCCCLMQYYLMLASHSENGFKHTTAVHRPIAVLQPC